MVLLDETTVHIIGGGIGGTVGAVFTCPLELIKVRFQSSEWGKLSGSFLYPASQTSKQANSRQTHFKYTFPSEPVPVVPFSLRSTPGNFNASGVVHQQTTTCEFSHQHVSEVHRLYTSLTANHTQPTFSRKFHSPEASVSFVQQNNPFFRSKIIRCMAEVGRTEGYRALFKGLMPTLVGVLPSRGIYFCAYHKGQQFFQQYFPENHSLVYMLSAGFSSITASTATCPIWYIKTRLQLDSRPCSKPVTVGHVIRSTWKELGFRGFYRGVSASYVGSVETALNFAIYENVKGFLLSRRRDMNSGVEICLANNNYRGTQGGSKLESTSDMALCMVASAFSKVIAITVAYPHEVARTRMREPGKKYRTFIGTIRTVAKEEGFAGLYRGLGTHYVRQVPNTCLILGTYEGVVFLLDSWGFVRPRPVIDITA